MGLVINAPNIHMGGGRALLTALLKALDGTFSGSLVLDARMALPAGVPQGVSVHRIQPTIRGRLIGEWRLRQWAGPGDVVLCLGNLPPLFRLRSRVIVFLQNRYQIEKRSLEGFRFPSRTKMMMERAWFMWTKRHVSTFFVQTPSMLRAVKKATGLLPEIVPFVQNPEGYKRGGDFFPPKAKAHHDFLYVASGEPHKNHPNLIEAWSLLARDGLQPRLFLTLDPNRFPALTGWIEQQKQARDLMILNLGVLPSPEIQDLYKRVDALIYPSSFESFGLPLVEARCSGVPIIASERDYVRDVVDPEQTFDPDSPLSIARAVKRFLGRVEDPLPVIDAKAFLEIVASGGP